MILSKQVSEDGGMRGENATVDPELNIARNQYHSPVFQPEFLVSFRLCSLSSSVAYGLLVKLRFDGV